MTRDERAAARMRCEAAGKGPWTAEGFRVYWGDDFPLVEAVEDGQFDGTAALHALSFIAHAKLDLPAALDEIDRLEGMIGAYERCRDLWNKGMESTCDDRDRLKQENRRLQGRVAELEAALEKSP